MADRSFEEKVKDEFAGLSLKPGAEVWQHIESSLQKKKKHRWLLWLLLLCGCAAGSLLVYNAYRKEERPVASGNIIPKNKENDQPVHARVNSLPKATPDQQKNSVPSQQPVAIVTEQTVTISKNKKILSEDVLPKSLQKEKIITREISTPTVALKGKTNTGKTIPDAVHEKQNPIAEKSAPANESAIPQPKDPVDTKLLQADISKKADTATDKKEEAIHQPEPVKNEPAMPPQEAISKKDIITPWRFAIATNLGSSGTMRTPSIAFARTASSSFAAAPGSANFGLPVVYKTPSRTDAFSFGFSVEASKNTGGRNGFSLSLGYELYQSRIGVGTRVDSTLIINSTKKTNDDGFYFISTDEKKYTAHYHFLHAGFSLFRMSKPGKPVTLRWQVGAGAAFLLAGDALHYDAQNNILFRNYSLLNKLELDLSAGINIGFGKEPVFFIGPQLTYFLSAYSQFAGNTDQHLFRGGIKTTFILRRKKK